MEDLQNLTILVSMQKKTQYGWSNDRAYAVFEIGDYMVNSAIVSAETPIEKPTTGSYTLPADTTHDKAIHRIRTAVSISISPELFEKPCLSPQNVVHGDLRRTFGNPTPLALVGFVVALIPLSIEFAGWRGTGGSGVGATETGVYFFFGGLLVVLGSVGEWILGNTFPFVVFGTYVSFFLSFAATLQPAYNAWGAYATDTSNPATDLKNPDFYTSHGFFFLSLALLSFFFLVGSIRTNIAFFVVFLTLTLGFSTLTGTYWQVANGNAALAGKLQKASGDFLFVTSISGWWILVALILASLDSPFQVPGNPQWLTLSRLVKGASERATVNENKVWMALDEMMEIISAT